MNAKRDGTDDDVEVKTEIKKNQALTCVVMGLKSKQKFVLAHSSQYSHSMINFCKQLMSNVKDEHILCQIDNEDDINNLSDAVDNADVLSHRIENAIDNDVDTVYFVIVPIEKVYMYLHVMYAVADDLYQLFVCIFNVLFIA